jgi:hypothetical protein
MCISVKVNSKFGNTLIRGTVIWTWKIDGRVYHTRSAFVAGLARGYFRVPKTAKGILLTRYRDVYHQS